MTAPAVCATHPDRPAELRCEGCSALLCGECIREGHRLLFCTLCGERALPLDTAAPTTTPGRRRQAATAYTYRQALAYPFRGLGGYAYWGLVGLLLVFELVPRLLPLGGCLVLLPQLFILLIFPGFLFSIAETTAQGVDELPDWPEVSPLQNLGDILLFLFIGALAQIPMVLLLFALRCDLESIFLGQASVGACFLALALGLPAAAALWLPAFGSTAVYSDGWLSFRFDLHVRAALVSPNEFFTAAGLIGGLLVTGAAVPLLLALLPLPTMIWSFLGNAVVAYALFVAAHLAGVYFRRHPEELKRLYLP